MRSENSLPWTGKKLFYPCDKLRIWDEWWRNFIAFVLRDCMLGFLWIVCPLVYFFSLPLTMTRLFWPTRFPHRKSISLFLSALITWDSLQVMRKLVMEFFFDVNRSAEVFHECFDDALSMRSVLCCFLIRADDFHRMRQIVKSISTKYYNATSIIIKWTIEKDAELKSHLTECEHLSFTTRCTQIHKEMSIDSRKSRAKLTEIDSKRCFLKF